MIHVHRPLSQLHQHPLDKLSSRAPSHSNDTDESQWLHTAKTLAAAESVIALYALPGQIVRHSPLMIRGLSIATSVQMSACTALLRQEEWLMAWNRVRLGMGALKAFGEVWVSGGRTEKEMRGVMRGVWERCRPGGKVGVEGFGVSREVDFGVVEVQNLGFMERGMEEMMLQDYEMWEDGSILI